MKATVRDSAVAACQALRERLGEISTADAADHLRMLGVSHIVMRDIRALVPVRGTMAGLARTLRFLPDREDVGHSPSGPVNRVLYDTVNSGEVLVLDAMGCTTKAVLGDMMFARLQSRQIAAVVVDGAVRDVPVIAESGIPIFARGSCPEAFMTWLRPWEADCAIQCGGVLVKPGDWILADAEGVIVVPGDKAERLAEQAEKKRSRDAFSKALLAAGFPLDDAYPLPAYMLRFEGRFAANGRLPTEAEVREARTR